MHRAPTPCLNIPNRHHAPPPITHQPQHPSPREPRLAEGTITTYRRRQRRQRITWLLIILAGLLILLYFARTTDAAGPTPPPDPKTQTYYTCRYIRHEATSRLCIQFRPHRQVPAFKPKN
jgi:hypothetical protein